MFGLMVLNKPAGMTSREAVNFVVPLVHPAKAGHAGTLDPMARGVLVVCIGAATRLVEYVQRMPKEYRGVFLLGRHSPTEDVDSTVTLLENPPIPSAEDVSRATAGLVGTIQQRPPVFSAVKVGGRRAYQLARRGRPVQLAPRPVTVHRLNVVRYEYPELVLDVVCGAGTYIRSLGRDLAASLGTAAVMSDLTRTAVGSFRIEDACPLEMLSPEAILGRLLPPIRAVESLPAIRPGPAALARLAHGLDIEVDAPQGATECAVLDEQGQLRAIAVRREDGRWRPTRNFAANQA
jgi:tRNA pseudouridine55 synthase